MIRIFADSTIPDTPIMKRRNTGISFIFNSSRRNSSRRVVDRTPSLVLYHGPEERTISNIVNELRDKGLVKGDRVARSNGIVDVCSFTILVGTLVKILRPIIVEWIKAAGKRRIEVKIGNNTVRASTERGLKTAFALLEKHKSAGVTVKKSSQSKKVKKPRV